jgi:hypothetical protein
MGWRCYPLGPSQRPRRSRSVLGCGSPLFAMARSEVVAKLHVSDVQYPQSKHRRGGRTPKPGRLPSGLDGREAAWTAVALYRFALARSEVVAKLHRSDVQSSRPKRGRGGRTPKPGGLPSGFDGREASWTAATLHSTLIIRQNQGLSSLRRMRRYSICPRSPSRPIGPVAGSLRADSSTSPLQVQKATPLVAMTSTWFQSCGL